MNKSNHPLAERMRPRTLSDVVGQEHLLAPGKPLARMVEQSELVSMIFWGPPGSGKTTLAKLLTQTSGANFFELSAISSGVKELRLVIDEARNSAGNNKRTVLFIDEIHRFNKAQQDALLGAVEDGTITLIGATTENPSFEVISPLLSRCRVFTLKGLTEEDLATILHRAVGSDAQLKEEAVEVTDEEYLIGLSGGDARMLLNGLELAVTIARSENGKKNLKREHYEEAFGRKASRYDKQGEEHYNIISAFIKSMRGSDPDGAIYWLARMIEGGEDVRFIARRMVILASEDIGNADPNALLLATTCFSACEMIGWPESQIILSQTVAYLAAAPKSNAAVAAIGEARRDVRDYPNEPVPLHLRNAPTKLMKEEGYGVNYKYAHSYEGNFVEQQFLPDKLTDRIYYQPSENGREKAIKERLESLWKKRRK